MSQPLKIFIKCYYQTIAAMFKSMLSDKSIEFVDDPKIADIILADEYLQIQEYDLVNKTVIILHDVNEKDIIIPPHIICIPRDMDRSIVTMVILGAKQNQEGGKK